MGRLTRKVEDDGVKAVWFGKREVFLEGETGYAEADKLAHYEDLEEQGYKMVNTDKVVEQLLKNAYKVTEKNTNLEHTVIGLIDVIKIVKGGGTDE